MLYFLLHQNSIRGMG